MDVASLFLRILDTNGAIYLPYHFEGDWTDEEKAQIEKAINPHVPEKVDAGFNNWRFSKHSWGFLGKRATWDMLFSTATAEEMAQKVSDYYSR